jgi:hypothetical protein
MGEPLPQAPPISRAEPTTVETKNTTVVTQNDTTVLDFREKNFDKKLLVFMYLVVLAAMLGYMGTFATVSDLVLGFFIGQLGIFGGALGNIITGKQANDQQRSTDTQGKVTKP